MNKKQKIFTALLLIVLFILGSMLTSLSYEISFLSAMKWVLIAWGSMMSVVLLVMGVIYCYYKLGD